jgi:hypothetical protein
MEEPTFSRLWMTCPRTVEVLERAEMAHVVPLQYLNTLDKS